MSLDRVPGEDELYIGGIFTLRRKSALAEVGITHIVSVLKYDFEQFEDCEKYGHLSVDVDDMEGDNLLAEFEGSGAFIEEALRKGKDDKKGKVLIHCAMGKSRSVTICIAYLMRQYPHHTVESALALIREARPMAEPNPGFMAQLKLYKDMGCPRDIDDQPKYQRWLYQIEVGEDIAAGRAPENVKFSDEEILDQEATTNEVAGEKDVELRCRKCRRSLATTPYLISHLAPQASALTNRPPPPTHTLHTHHFLQPLSWMRPTLSEGHLSGRLECPNPKCSAQIGRYAWQGMKCNCGTWVCPAFSLGKAKVDEISLAKRIPNMASEKGKDGFRVANTTGTRGSGIERTAGGGDISDPSSIVRELENLNSDGAGDLTAVAASDGLTGGER